jgi:hypothetical protein
VARFAFIGPSYQSLTPNADAEDTINLFTSNIEESGKSKQILEPTPGLKVFSVFPGRNSVRGDFSVFSTFGATFPGRTFAAAGTALYEVHSDGTNIQFTTAIVDDTLPVYFVSGPNGAAGGAGGKWQLFFSSGGHAYVLDLTAVPPAGLTDVTASIVAITSAGALISRVEYLDGRFIALIANTNQFAISALLDATDWTLIDGAGAAKILVFTDNVVGMIENQKLLAFFGPKQTVFYQDTGDTFPFNPIEGSLIEEGTIAKDSIQKMNNSIFFLSGDERGAGIVYRISGYTPTRISNHAVELSIRGLPSTGLAAPLSDAVGWVEQDAGHSFYVLWFPAGNMTWVYDLTTSQWHKRLFWNAVIPGSNPVADFDPAYPAGTYVSHLGRCHTYNFGKHLVGGRLTGNLYDMSQSYLDDTGYPIRRLRRAPNISIEEEYEFHKRLQIDVETGIGQNILDAQGNPREPLIFLRWSDDGGHAWGNYHALPCGMIGQYKRRAIQRRMGKSRDRVYEMTCTDAVSWRFVDAYLRTSPTLKKTQQLKQVYRAMGI